MRKQADRIHTELNRFLKEPKLKNLYTETRKLFMARQPVAHNWEHVERDIINAVYIGLEEKADMNIVMPAIILHDLGYITNPEDPREHAQNGSDNCFKYLGDWLPEEKQKISGCILKHKGKFPGFDNSEPKTLEEKVVCDADQLDKFGWVGFIQTIMVYMELGLSGKINNSIFGLPEFIKHLEALNFYTETGRRLAYEIKEQTDFMIIAGELAEELVLYKDRKTEE